jgi:hypothetical protein
MSIHKQQLERIRKDSRYQENIEWGSPRPGHPEGTVQKHILELESNLNALEPETTSFERDKLRLLIHVHDSFKKEAKRGVAITDPHSHASLARSFLAGYCSDLDLLNMVQFHDEPYALFKRERRGQPAGRRLQELITRIKDWRLFLLFLVVDSTTIGKSREPLRWALARLAEPLGFETDMRRWIAVCEARSGQGCSPVAT